MQIIKEPFFVLDSTVDEKRGIFNIISILDIFLGWTGQGPHHGSHSFDQWSIVYIQI